MSKCHPNPLSWRWRHHPSQQHPTHLALHLIAALLLLLSLILLLIGSWQLGFIPLALGAIGLYATLAMLTHGYHLERN